MAVCLDIDQGCESQVEVWPGLEGYRRAVDSWRGDWEKKDGIRWGNV